MIGENDHVSWLRRQAGILKQAAAKETDEKKRRTKEGTAERLRGVAGALESALAGTEPGAMGGHMGLQKRLHPGTKVRVRMMTGEEFLGEIRAVGKYDFALQRGPRELVVAKHGVAYFELLGPQADFMPDGEGTEEE